MAYGLAPHWVILAVLLVGCAGRQSVQSVSLLERLRHFEPPTGRDVLQIDVALIERPIGDSYLNRQLWMLDADEQVIPLEHKAVLEENGFRVGQIGGITPAGLQSLLLSKQNCVHPRHYYLRAGNSELLELGPKAATCAYRVQGDGGSQPISLPKASCGLRVVPFATGDGQMRLQMTPEVSFGEAVLALRPSEDNSGIIPTTDRPRKTFASMAWEVTLGPNQYLVVGARLDRPDSLGYQCFVRHAEGTPVQRLLVIRAYPAATEGDVASSVDGDEPDSNTGRAVPLAIQAAYSTARGTSQ
jgi:hypothetical protein